MSVKVRLDNTPEPAELTSLLPSGSTPDWFDGQNGIFAIDPHKAYIGIVHETGAYLVELRRGTNAARYAVLAERGAKR